MLAARRRYGGKAVVLMMPGLPVRCFDLCLVPQHDHPPVSDRVIATTGMLNGLTNRHVHRDDQALIAVGGPSRHYRWNDDALLGQIERLMAAQPARHWTLTNSPRTPESFVCQLAQRYPDRFVAFQPDNSGWFADRLQEAGQVWVSEDSQSMIYEALTAGARVGLLAVARKRDDRITAAIDQLVKQARIGAPGCFELPEPDGRELNEAQRCARRIRELWFENN